MFDHSKPTMVDLKNPLTPTVAIWVQLSVCLAQDAV